MNNRCPNCGFEPVEQDLICPNCGIEIKENITEKLTHDSKENNVATQENAFIDEVEAINFEDTKELNDDIVWSDLQDEPIGKVMKNLAEEHDIQLADNEIAEINSALTTDSDFPDESENQLADFVLMHKEKLSEAQNSSLEENPILASYLEMHNANKDTKKQLEELDDSTNPDNESLDNQDEIENQKANRPQFDSDYIEDTLPESDEDPVVLAMKKIDEFNQPKSSFEQESESDNETSSKKWRNIALVGATVLLVGGGFYYSHYQRQKDSEQHIIEQINKQVSQLAKKINNLYTTKQASYLKDSVTLAEINQLEKELKNFDGQKDYQKLKKQLADAKEQLLKVQEINDYFTSPVLKEGKLNKHAALDYSKKFDMKLISNPESSFDKLANEAILFGQKAYTNYEKARTATKELSDGYKNGILASSVTREKYQQAKKLVEQLVDSKQKDEMEKQLQTIDQALTKNEQAAKKDDAESSQNPSNSDGKSTQAATSSPVVQIQSNPVNTQPIYTSRINEQSEILSPQSTHQNANQPLIASRPSDLQDVNNSAWQWADGVQDRVLQACIGRGYIVSGGYVLERVRIENQEGYYNLFAVMPSAKFPNASSKNPIYVVTINCKTGFYKGNGNDHTIR
ncbi:cell division site-positioning protein MapZ family protein [Enterococcus cecorum]|uniref:cell division site-positioning protein MapZ family protein n=1 Tax=Enterococcus cecorum TaxID=44008 RepID=UPI00200B9E3F|nr:cell division site-positioning protein MapZ family protein [Enterococcus cecorum]